MSTITSAVAYVASDGYLFETIVSAVQARNNVPSDTQIFIFFVSDFGRLEHESFQDVANHAGINLERVPTDALEGLPVKAGRLMLSQWLPTSVRSVVYMDGDTQVVADLSLLVSLDVRGKIAAARDPMTFIRHTHRRRSSDIDAWLRGSGLGMQYWDNYINSGVFVASRDRLEQLRIQVSEVLLSSPATRFVDQDAINCASVDTLQHLSLAWNFPGFMLNSRVEHLIAPRIVHFMSRPRPWHGAFKPWGERYHYPYKELVRNFPETEPYWVRANWKERRRYEMQYLYKSVSESYAWNSSAAMDIVKAQERDVLLPSIPAGQHL